MSAHFRNCQLFPYGQQINVVDRTIKTEPSGARPPGSVETSNHCVSLN